ncbi:acyl-CoA thioesterase [Streptomyces muensis]|uniref:Thioesterase family protein n=1 Tax=Streptomyces muensis TaxID=1077944 RepID=A0A9X1PSY2_STRM4|nr:thioesterase family protein [Streptomyces muensis]MCF1592538.1 thioesterase family protein [Streptomyces muensis]
MSVTLHRRVTMVDVDLVQVNFARFFYWMDAAYAELLVDLGHPLSQVIAEQKATPAVRSRCDYRRPVGLDDEFRIRAAITRVGTSSYTVSFRFEDAEGLFALGAVDYVWVNTLPRQHSAPAPPWIAAACDPGFLEGTERR